MSTYKLIACKVLQRELSLLSASCPNNIDISFIRRGLHNTPELLQKALQEEIDRVESDKDLHTNESYKGSEIKAILIGYGLCSNGIQELTSKKYPLVIPRAHDCISLFLGSKDIYRKYFDTHAGVYWYTRGWMETSDMPNGAMVENKRREYEEKGYDEEDIEYLLDAELSWVKTYKHLTYIRTPEIADAEYIATAKSIAADLGWQYEQLEGDTSLLKRFLDGDWDEESFQIVQPGQTVQPSYDRLIIKAK